MDWEQTASTTNIGTNSKLNWEQTSSTHNSHGTGTNNKMNWEQTNNSRTNYKEQTGSPEQIGTNSGTNWEQINRRPKGHYIVREQTNTHQQNQNYRQNQNYIQSGQNYRTNPGTKPDYKLEYKPKYTTNSKKYRNMAFETCPQNSTGPIAYLWSCTQYLNCYKGRGFVQNCAAGTNFNPETLECDFPHKVKCISGARNQKVKSEKYSRLDDISKICEPNFSGLLPHPTDCTKFVNCANGQTFIQDCGPGTAFNSVIQACDFADKVGCEISGQKDNYELQESEIRSFINPNLNYNFEPGSQYLDQNYKDVSVIRVYDNNQLGYGQNCGPNCPTNNQQQAGQNCGRNGCVYPAQNCPNNNCGQQDFNPPIQGQTHTQNCPNNNCGPYQTGQNFNQQWTGQNRGQIQPGSQTNCASGNCKNAGQNCHGPNCGTNYQTGTQFTPTVQEELGQNIYYGQSGQKCEGLNCGTNQQTGTQFTPTYYGQSRPKCEGQNCGTIQPTGTQFTPTYYGQSGPKCEGQNCGTSQQFTPTQYEQSGPNCEGPNCGTNQQTGTKLTSTYYGQSGPKCEGQNCGTTQQTGTQFTPIYQGQIGPKCEGQNCRTNQQFQPTQYGQSRPKCEGQNCGTSQQTDTQFTPTYYGQSGPKCEGQNCGTSQQTGTQFTPVYQGQLGQKCEGQNCGTSQQFQPTQYGQSEPKCEGQNCGTSQQTGTQFTPTNYGQSGPKCEGQNCGTSQQHGTQFTPVYQGQLGPKCEGQNCGTSQQFTPTQYGQSRPKCEGQNCGTSQKFTPTQYGQSGPKCDGQNCGTNQQTGRNCGSNNCQTNLCNPNDPNCNSNRESHQLNLTTTYWANNNQNRNHQQNFDQFQHGTTNFEQSQSSANTYSHPNGYYLHSRPNEHVGQNLGQNIPTGRTNSDPICPTGHSGIVPHPFICKKFLNCAAGQTFIQECSLGKVFNPKTSACDWPHNVKCPTADTQREIISQNPTIYGGQNFGQSSSNTYSHPTGHHLHSRPTGHSGRYIQTSGQNLGQNIPTGKTNSDPICPAGYSGIVPHPSICKKFLNCAAGQTFIQDCGPGTVFNPKISACDWPHNVKCPTVDAKREIITQNQPGFQSGTNNAGQNYADQNRGQKNYTNVNYNSGQYGQNTGQYHDQNFGQNRGQTAQRNYTRYVHNSGTNYGQNSGYNSTNTNQNSYNIRGTYNGHHYGQNSTRFGQYFGQQVAEDTQTSNSEYRPIYWTQYGNNQSNIGGTKFSQNYGQNNRTGINQNSFGSAGYTGVIGYRRNPPLSQDIIEPVAPTTLNYTINVNQNPKKTGKHWPPPFPSTDTSADYYFEDVTEPSATKTGKKIWKNAKTCGENEFECSKNECIPENLRCNGNEDCANGSDEKDCRKYSTEFTLIPNSRLYRHEVEKWLNTDLETCAKYCLNSKNFGCKSFNYRKENNVCLLCDSNVGLSGALADSHFYDYYEITAEAIDCSNMHKCSNKKCIKHNQICDGNDDCGNREDEKKCSAQSIGYEMKLAGSNLKNEGRIEVKIFDEWGYICDDKFGLRNADVVCKELGFNEGALEVKSGSFFARDIKDNETYYLMDDVQCVGNESTIRDCDFNGWGTHNCMPQEIVGVVCKTAKEICPPDHWKCDTTKECLPMQFLCDGVVDCFDKSDEGIQHCETPNEVRIVNGTSKYEGRVEIRYHGVWGTICDDDFNDMTAKVVCNSLGFHGSAVAKKDGAFGPGSGPIWLDQLNCYGNESAVEDCAHWNWGEHNCAHDEDAGVVCSDLDASEYEKRSKDESMIGHFPLKPNLDDTLFEGKCGFRGDDLFNDESNENSDIHFRVVKGSTARKGDYPWQATIRVKGLLKSAHWCGAVVISNKYVLTAAHCLVGFAKGSYIINAGDYNIDEKEGTESEAYIEDFFVHEKFRQGGQMNNDIALIKLKGSGLKLSKQIQPICLPSKNTQYRPGLNCTISGFGSTETGKSASSRVLRAGWVKIQPDDTCKMSQVYGDAITNGMFCAGSLDEGVDSCDGDSGGPLACLENGLFTLYGITSWGQRCGHANKPGVYVKVVEYRDWIDRMIQSSS